MDIRQLIGRKYLVLVELQVVLLEALDPPAELGHLRIVVVNLDARITSPTAAEC